MIADATRFDSPPEEFTPLLCGGWTLSGEMCMWDVLAWMRERQAPPGHRLFATLDDRGQAF